MNIDITTRKEKMKILYILNTAREVTSFSKSSIMAAKGLKWEYHIAGNWQYSNLAEKEKQENEFGIKIHQISFERSPFNLKNFYALMQLNKLMRQEKFDIIHCNTPIGGVLGRIIGVKYKCKIIYQAHGFHFFKGSSIISWLLYYPVEKILSRFTDVLITINKEDYLIASSKFYAKKVELIPGVGIDLSLYKKLEVEEINLKKLLGLTDLDVVCISMGDLILRKNYKTAIEAIYKANNKNIHYLICGKGPEEQELKKLCKKLNIVDQVHFLGFRSDIKQLLCICDIFLFTSLQEGLPRSMMEAMASGLPCVASKIRGNIDLLEDGRGGFLVEPTDSENFAQKLNLLANDMNLRTKMKKYNLKRVTKFDIKKVENNLNQVYETVIGE